MKDLANSVARTAQFVPVRPVSFHVESVPVLTVMYHPDISRVGDYVVLDALERGADVQLGRNILEFVDLQSGLSGPLADLHVSRNPLIFGRRGDGYSLSVPETGSQVQVDGERVNGASLHVSRDALQRGMSIELASRVLLHWQLSQPPTTEGNTVAPGLLGQSAVLAEVRHAIAQVAPLDIDVLVLGESGTGKELVAQAIHSAGPQASQQLVTVNIPAIPPSLCASELFGSVHGAFTGSRGNQTGYFEQANGSTLFLDEIGDAPLEVQATLLRALESREIHPVGGTPIRLDLRVISATDADLEAGISNHSFKSALRHRLAGFEIRLPALDERGVDVAVLALHFLNEQFASFGDCDRLAKDGADDGAAGQWVAVFGLLASYSWPGNVRELRNMMCQIAVHNRDMVGVVLPGDVRQTLMGDTRPASKDAGGKVAESPGKSSKAVVTEQQVREALSHCWWEPTDAARMLHIKRQTIYRLFKTSSTLRAASDVDIGELKVSHEKHAGRLDDICRDLEVSRAGLRRRLGDLKLVWT